MALKDYSSLPEERLEKLTELLEAISEELDDAVVASDLTAEDFEDHLDCGYSQLNGDIIEKEAKWGLEACFKKLATLCDLTKLRAIDLTKSHYGGIEDLDIDFKKISNGFKGKYHEYNPKDMVIRKCKLENMEFYNIKDEQGDLDIIIAHPILFDMAKEYADNDFEIPA